MFYLDVLFSLLDLLFFIYSGFLFFCFFWRHTSTMLFRIHRIARVFVALRTRPTLPTVRPQSPMLATGFGRTFSFLQKFKWDTPMEMCTGIGRQLVASTTLYFGLSTSQTKIWIKITSTNKISFVILSKKTIFSEEICTSRIRYFTKIHFFFEKQPNFFWHKTQE